MACLSAAAVCIGEHPSAPTVQMPAGLAAPTAHTKDGEPLFEPGSTVSVLYGIDKPVRDGQIGEPTA